MKKRMLSIFLVVVLCLTLVPTAALAADELDPNGGSIAVGWRTESGSSTCSYLSDITELVEWLFDESAATELQLLANVDLTEADGTEYGTTIPGDLVLDLNGHTIRFDGEVNTNNGLTILDRSESGSGSVYADKILVGHLYDEDAGEDTEDERIGKLVISGGTVNCPVEVELGSLRVSGGTLTETATIRHEISFYNGEINRVTVTGGQLSELVVEAFGLYIIRGGSIDSLKLGYATTGGLYGGEFGKVSFQKSAGISVSYEAVHFLASGYAFFGEEGELVNALRTPAPENVTVRAHECQFDDSGWCGCGRIEEELEGEEEEAVAKVEKGTFVEYVTEQAEFEYLFAEF